MAVSRLDSYGPGIRAINAAKSINRLAKADSILTRLSTISQNDEVAPSMLDRLICTDATLGRTVPLAIAAFSDSESAVPSSIADAVRLFGYQSVRRVVQIAGVSEIHREFAARSGLNHEQLTRQAVAVGLACEYLGSRSFQPLHFAFTAGILANLGVGALAISEKAYRTVSTLVPGGNVQLHDAEQSVLGMNHHDAGLCIAVDYGFPEVIGRAIAQSPQQNPPQLNSLLFVAESFAHQLGFDGGFAITPTAFDNGAFARLGGTSGDAERLASQITRWNSQVSKLIA